MGKHVNTTTWAASPRTSWMWTKTNGARQWRKWRKTRSWCLKVRALATMIRSGDHCGTHDYPTFEHRARITMRRSWAFERVKSRTTSARWRRRVMDGKAFVIWTMGRWSSGRCGWTRSGRRSTRGFGVVCESESVNGSGCRLSIVVYYNAEREQMRWCRCDRTNS